MRPGRLRFPAAAFAAALAFSLPAAAAAQTALPPSPPGFAQADQEIDALQGRLAELKKALEPELEALERLSASYRDPAAFEAAAAGRAPTREAVKAKVAELADSAQRFDLMREQTQVQKVVAGLQTMMTGGEMPKGTGIEFLRSNARLAFSQEVQAFRVRAETALHLDEESFRAAVAVAELEKRRLVELWAAGAGALLLLALAALLVENSRLRRALRGAALPPPA